MKNLKILQYSTTVIIMMMGGTVLAEPCTAQVTNHTGSSLSCTDSFHNNVQIPRDSTGQLSLAADANDTQWVCSGVAPSQPCSGGTCYPTSGSNGNTFNVQLNTEHTCHNKDWTLPDHTGGFPLKSDYGDYACIPHPSVASCATDPAFPCCQSGEARINWYIHLDGTEKAFTVTTKT